ncbi:hypothetical protein PUN28_005420 [Cardiocondyla obscurior]|uniref:PDZ domain-containing protein n=1 Tax=Cardiocondyla obscurior TaxID=286306 RepID=A0AAW2GLV5_9HYME
MVHTSYAQWACLPSTYRKKVNPGSKASQQGVREGDLISTINGRSTRDLTNSEAHALLRNSGEQLKLGLNQENIGSPKRRIYRSSLQENTTTEIQNKITTRTTTTTCARTETDRNAANDTKVEQGYANQNGALKSCPSDQRSDEAKKGKSLFIGERRTCIWEWTTLIYARSLYIRRLLSSSLHQAIETV